MRDLSLRTRGAFLSPQYSLFSGMEIASNDSAAPSAGRFPTWYRPTESLSRDPGAPQMAFFRSDGRDFCFLGRSSVIFGGTTSDSEGLLHLLRNVGSGLHLALAASEFHLVAEVRPAIDVVARPLHAFQVC